MNIAVFASHGGSDLQAIIDGCKSNKIKAKVAVVISNNGTSKALERANKEKIPFYHLSAKKSGSEETLAKEILEILSGFHIEMIFLAGYMRMLHLSVLEKYENRIFNIHPALLPKFGRKGMYGMNVHHAVIEAQETETGITIHRVTAEYDSGEVVAQTKVPVKAQDTPELLAERVLEREHEFLVEVISSIASGSIPLGNKIIPDRKVNPNYTGTCGCGRTRSENEAINQRKAEEERLKQTASPETDNFQMIKQYKELLDTGVISQEEFEKKKKELLNL